MQNIKSKGFTLLELLVVIGIIGILVAISVPLFGTGKRQAAIAACQSNLKSLAPAIRSYSLDHRGLLPEVANMPSLEISDLPSLPEALKGYAPFNGFKCPRDVYVPYHEREGSSYEYNTRIAGEMIDEMSRGEGLTWMLCDYEPFHADSAWEDGAINYLFVNGDVTGTYSREDE
jgi:prepilin-type N-terminal cleavage/methylation domain-containing protein